MTRAHVPWHQLVEVVARRQQAVLSPLRVAPMTWVATLRLLPCRKLWSDCPMRRGPRFRWCSCRLHVGLQRSCCIWSAFSVRSYQEELQLQHSLALVLQAVATLWVPTLRQVPWREKGKLFCPRWGQQTGRLLMN